MNSFKATDSPRRINPDILKWRNLVALILIVSGSFTFLPSCKRSSKLTSFVDAPVTIEAIRGLEKSGALVKIERVEKSPGGGACGHSPVCLIVIPFVLLGSIFPEKYDLVTVTESNQITYSGMFTTDGEFIQARLTSKGMARDLRRLDLDELEKRVVVEIASGPLDSNGKPGEMKPSAVFALTHLDQEYSTAMQKGSDSQKAKLLIEATTWFGEESIPMLKTWLSSNEASPEFKTLVIDHTCERMRNDRKDSIASAALEAMAMPNHTKPALAALACFVSDDPAASPYLKALVKLTCQGGERSASIPGTMISWNARATQSPGSIKRRIATDASKELDSCQDPARTLLRTALDLPVEQKDILALLSNSAYRNSAVSYMDASIPNERNGLLSVVAAKSEASGALERLANNDWVASPAEMASIAEQYIPDYHSVFASSDYKRRATILDIFSFQKDPEARRAALTVFERAASKAESDRLPELRIAMVVLGERQFAIAAAHGLRSREKHSGGGTDNASGLISYGLVLSGCKVDEIADAYRATITAKDSDRGVLCTR
ncbi:MAG: hypothetical protein JNM27_14390 [Leptospirales bacterium]|nr:hypothetical protein [Leptospirales bacterium]